MRAVSQRKGLFPGLAGVSDLAVWPKGRLVALACEGEGEFATVLVEPPGDRICLNAIVAPAGYLEVAVRARGSAGDMPGRGFAECDRLVGDDLAMPVRWRWEEAIGDGGAPISLRFRMKQAELYGDGGLRSIWRLAAPAASA